MCPRWTTPVYLTNQGGRLKTMVFRLVVVTGLELFLVLPVLLMIYGDRYGIWATLEP